MSESLAGRSGSLLDDRYRLGSLIGEGGAGFVYEAEQVPLGRTVAVKLLRAGAIDIERFREEARTASRIDHPNAVAIYDFGVSQHGVPYLAMERVHGRTLTQLIAEGTLSVARAGEIARQILAAVDEAHNCGVVHRDLKPDNVIVDLRRDQPRVKVIDFGLARLRTARDLDHVIAGTPGYMAPEQITGADIGPAADLYAVGVLLYEMLVGRTPFAGGSLTAILDRTLSQAPIPLCDLAPRCPRALSELVDRALCKTSDGRPASARAMIADLLAALGCPHCGANRARSARFCVECGTTLTDLATGVAPASGRLAFATGSDAAQPSGTLEHEARWPLVGREQTVAEVARALTDAAGAVAVVGPRGSGKARVVNEAARAVAEHTSVIITGPDPSGQREAWYPVLAVLHAGLGIVERPRLETLDQHVATLGLCERDLPGLAKLFDVPGPLDGVELAVRRRETVAAARRALIALADQGFALCFLDVDDYDRPSRELLAHLAEQGVHLLLTCHDRDHVPDGASTFELSPLEANQTASLAHAIAVGSVRDLPCADALHSVTRGLPGVVEQLVGWLAEGGDIDDAHDAVEIKRDSAADLVSARISGLDPQERRALQAIAVFGEIAPDAAVRSVLGKLGSDGSGLERLCLRGLAGRQGDEWMLPSPLIASVALASAPASVRRRLHQCALDAFERHHGAATPRRIGHHAAGTEDLAVSFRALVAAGDHAVDRFDDAGASDCYSRAVQAARALITVGTTGAERLLVRASIRLANTLRFTGQASLAAGVLHEAAGFASELSDRAALARVRARVAAARRMFSVACELFREAIGLGLRLGDRVFLCETYVDLAGVLVDRGEPRAAVEELSEAIDVVTLWEGLGVRHDIASLWLLGCRLASLQLAAGDLDGARATATGALNQAEAADAPQARARLLALLADIAARTGDRELELEHRAAAIAELQKVGDRRSVAELLLANARTRRAQSMSDDADRSLALELVGELDCPELIDADT